MRRRRSSTCRGVVFLEGVGVPPRLLGLDAGGDQLDSRDCSLPDLGGVLTPDGGGHQSSSPRAVDTGDGCTGPFGYMIGLRRIGTCLLLPQEEPVSCGDCLGGVLAPVSGGHHPLSSNGSPPLSDDADGGRIGNGCLKLPDQDDPVSFGDCLGGVSAPDSGGHQSSEVLSFFGGLAEEEEAADDGLGGIIARRSVGDLGGGFCDAADPCDPPAGGVQDLSVAVPNSSFLVHGGAGT